MKKCEEWLEKHHPDMHERFYSQGEACLQLESDSEGICIVSLKDTL